SGPEAGEMLRLAVTGGADGATTAVTTGSQTPEPLTNWRTELGSVHHRPGAGLSVVYRVQYAIGETRVNDHVVASTVDLPETPGVAVLRRGPHEVRVWRRSDDPFLPG